MTLVVNLYGGPGTGKSTNAALVFGLLKLQGVNAELVTEYAKDLTWEKAFGKLGFGPLVTGKQMYRVQRLIDADLDVVVTDSPILMGTVYRGPAWSETWCEHVREVHRSWDTLDIFLQRNTDHHPYNPRGRSQTEDQARELDGLIHSALRGTPFEVVGIQAHFGTANQIHGMVCRRIGIDQEDYSHAEEVPSQSAEPRRPLSSRL